MLQVVSSTVGGEGIADDPNMGHSNTPIAVPVEVEIISETKCVCYIFTYYHKEI